MEGRILSAIAKDRGHYEAVKDLLGDAFSQVFSPISQTIAGVLEDFYARDGSARTCTKEELLDRVTAQGYNTKQSKAIEDVINSLDWSISVPNLLHDIRLQKQRRVGDKLAGLLANRAEPEEIVPLLDEWKEALGDDSNSSTDMSDDMVFREIPVEDLIRVHFSSEGTIPFESKVLNEKCGGGVRAGHHILIFARPEIGKTHFALDLASGWLSLGKNILYLGNEEPLADVTFRLVQRLCKVSRRDILENPERATGTAFARGYSGFTGISVAPGNFRLFNHLTEKYKPDIVFIEQLRNVDVGDDNRVTALEKAAIGARNLAKSRGVAVVSVTQAGESAEGKPFLGLSDIDFSKTGIPGAIDLAIGIGATEEYKRAGVRGISLPKNKLGGNHDTFLVRFNTNIGTVEEINS